MPEAAPVISAARPDRSAPIFPLPRRPPPVMDRSSTVVVGEGITQDGPGAMEQDPLVLG
jgi:hypothetical protein